MYENNQLQFILTSEGRIMMQNEDTYEYQYFLKDHLGNTRITLSQNGTVLQEDAYYPFGMNIAGLSSANSSPENKYKYNGKRCTERSRSDLEGEFGLDWYDYGARFYDAVLGRWHVIDSKAEKYIATTPYAYAVNIPVLFIDPDGNEIKIKRIQEEGKKGRVQITLTAKVYNASSKDLSSGDLNNFASLIGDQIKSSFGGDYKNVTVDVITNIDVIDDLSNTKGSDHLFMISDATDSDLQNDDGSFNAGASNIGGQVAKINSDIIGDDKQVQRTGAHEFGHMAGLEHPENEPDQNVREAASNDKNNLMHQSKTSTGTNIVEEQINKIEDENR